MEEPIIGHTEPPKRPFILYIIIAIFIIIIIVFSILLAIIYEENKEILNPIKPDHIIPINESFILMNQMMVHILIKDAATI